MQVKMLRWIACASQESRCEAKAGVGDGASELTETKVEDVKTVSTLPRELILHLMFTHLPMERIGRLQSLNKDWKASYGFSEL